MWYIGFVVDGCYGVEKYVGKKWCRERVKKLFRVYGDRISKMIVKCEFVDVEERVWKRKKWVWEGGWREEY